MLTYPILVVVMILLFYLLAEVIFVGDPICGPYRLLELP